MAAQIKQSCTGYDPAEHTLHHWDKMAGQDHVSCMLYTDLKTYLPGDILVKVDRMSMANSLEIRAPFLDYRIIEFAASLPSEWKIKGNNKKIILKKAFSHLLPASILNRPKHGFSVPLDSWFRGELRPLAEECLFKQSALSEYLSLPAVQRLWQEHQNKNSDHGTILWSLLMLSLWQREYQL
jgi:asparagine synthase (glutamine-hydrolysing)